MLLCPNNYYILAEPHIRQMFTCWANLLAEPGIRLVFTCEPHIKHIKHMVSLLLMF